MLPSRLRLGPPRYSLLYFTLDSIYIHSLCHSAWIFSFFSFVSQSQDLTLTSLNLHSPLTLLRLEETLLLITSTEAPTLDDYEF